MKLFNKIDKIARAEIEKTGFPQIYNYNIANIKGEELAVALHADVDLVKCGTALMDIKLGEALRLKKQPEHIKMSADYTKTILSQMGGVDSKTAELLVNCVEAHHGTVPFKSLEAEIVANADCFRFISEIGVFTTYKFALDLGKNHNDALDFVQFKLDEKYNTLSLPEAKRSLEKVYQKLTQLVKDAHITEDLTK